MAAVTICSDLGAQENMGYTYTEKRFLGYLKPSWEP